MTKRRKPLIHNANAAIPECITSYLTNSVLQLPDWTFKYRYLKKEFLSKYVSSETEPADVRRQRAINKWLATEMNNAATNDRLANLHEDFKFLPHVPWSTYRDKVCDIIRSIIGDTPPLEALIGSFSGGASTSRQRTNSFPASKYVGQADITVDCLDYFILLEDEVPGWSTYWDQLCLNDVPGNVLFTVPKKSDIDRCACKEPDINMFIQKGIGSYIRRSLQRVGIDLNDQSKNRILAYQGSKDGLTATLDLSSASDSISRELVFQFLPACWFSLLDAVRSKVTEIDGELHTNEMFSSMGNGFTFELESLLFYAVARATAYFEGISGVISVYGDDIIVPVSLAESLIWVLGYLGFETNESKSFWSGSFRESCGGHYYDGHDVTPFYLRKPVSTLIDLIHFANSLREWASRDGFPVLDPCIEALWCYCRDQIPREFWGGRDYSFKFQLVTPDLPRRRLQPVTITRNVEIGGYIHWLNTTWVRENASEGISTSTLSRPKELFRSRPAPRAVTGLHFLFLSEIMGDVPIDPN